MHSSIWRLYVAECSILTTYHSPKYYFKSRFRTHFGFIRNVIKSREVIILYKDLITHSCNIHQIMTTTYRHTSQDDEFSICEVISLMSRDANSIPIPYRTIPHQGWLGLDYKSSPSRKTRPSFLEIRSTCPKFKVHITSSVILSRHEI